MSGAMAASSSSSKRIPSSTADILTWPEEPPTSSISHTPVRPKPTDNIGSILLGAPLTPEEAEALRIKKQISELKKREITGSGIFSHDTDTEEDTPLVAKVHQSFVARSQILFGDDGPISPKRPVTLPEFAKQRELSGTLEAPLEEVHSKKSSSKSKVNELVGSDIFGPPPNVQPRTLFRIFTSTDATTSAIDPSSSLRKCSLASLGEDLDCSAKKINVHKAAELSGSDIFKDVLDLSVRDKSLSEAKRKEISGNDIFADEKPVVRDHLGGIRKPPGGGSSIALV